MTTNAAAIHGADWRVLISVITHSTISDAAVRPSVRSIRFTSVLNVGAKTYDALTMTTNAAAIHGADWRVLISVITHSTISVRPYVRPIHSFYVVCQPNGPKVALKLAHSSLRLFFVQHFPERRATTTKKTVVLTSNIFFRNTVTRRRTTTKNITTYRTSGKLLFSQRVNTPIPCFPFIFVGSNSCFVFLLVAERAIQPLVSLPPPICLTGSDPFREKNEKRRSLVWPFVSQWLPKVRWWCRGKCEERPTWLRYQPNRVLYKSSADRNGGPGISS